MFTIEDYKKCCLDELKIAKAIPKKDIIPTHVPMMEKILSNLIEDKRAMDAQMRLINKWVEYNPDANIQEARTCSALMVKKDDPDFQYMQSIICVGLDEITKNLNL